VPGIDAQFLAFGNITVNGSRLSVEARLWDLKNPQDPEAFFRGQRLGGEDTEDSARLLAHTFADKIIELIGGGIRGISRTKLAYVSHRAGGIKEIYVMDYDGGNPAPVTSYRSQSVMPHWSPDGEKLAFISYRRNTPDIEIMSWIDRRPFSFVKYNGTNGTPAWSPDGSRIAFASSKDATDGMELYTADWNGRNPRRLTVSRGIDISPAWNPRTGREIAFVSDRSGSQQIYIMDAEGTNVRRLINDGGDAENPAWSPDGQRIAFAWQKSGSSFDIYIHDLASGRNSQLTQNQGMNERPTWAPDGRHLAFASTRTGTSQIFSMLADGTKVRQLTITGRNEGPAWSGYIGQ
jgi:TolB protein